MPENETLMADLIARYGPEKAKEVYWGMAGEGKGPFGPKGKYRSEHESIAMKAGAAPLPGGPKKPEPRSAAKARAKRYGSRNRKR